MNLHLLRGIFSGLIADLAGYIRGGIIKGGISAWEVYDAKTDGQILVGDGLDIVSVPIGQDMTLVNTGATTVVGIQTRTVAANAPTDGQVYAWDNGASEWIPVDQGVVSATYNRIVVAQYAQAFPTVVVCQAGNVVAARY